jgi:MFS family permease
VKEGGGQAGSWVRPALPVAAGVLLVSMIAHFRVPLLPAIGRELQMTPSQLGLVATTFAVGRLAVDRPVGRLADRFDPLQLLASAAGVMAVSSIALAAAPSAGWVFAASACLGAASATANTTGMTALSGSAPDRRRGSAMAIYSGSLLGGQALGPATSGAVAALGTWRTAASFAGGLGLVVAGAALALRRRTVIPRTWRDEEPAENLPPLTRLERAVLNSIGFSVFFTIGAMPLTIIPLVGALEFGLSVTAVGLALGLGGLARIVGAAVSGVVSDRVSRRSALLPALILQASGVALIAFAESPITWVTAIVLMSLGSSGNAVGATMLGDRSRAAALGRTLGSYRFYGDAGLVVGPAVAGVVFDVYGTAPAVGLVSGVLVLGALAAAAVLPETLSVADARGSRHA